MKYKAPTFILLSFLLISCSKTGVNISTTIPVKSVSKFFEVKKIDSGIYFVKEKTPYISKRGLMQKLMYHSAEFTLKQGYSRFVTFVELGDDKELAEAIDNNEVRELYLKRIKNKSPLMNESKIIVTYKHDQYFRETHIILVMLKNGKDGLSAKAVLKKLNITNAL